VAAAEGGALTRPPVRLAARKACQGRCLRVLDAKLINSSDALPDAFRRKRAVLQAGVVFCALLHAFSLKMEIKRPKKTGECLGGLEKHLPLHRFKKQYCFTKNPKNK
jgi:hypothetical protein